MHKGFAVRTPVHPSDRGVAELRRSAAPGGQYLQLFVAMGRDVIIALVRCSVKFLT